MVGMQGENGIECSDLYFRDLRFGMGIGSHHIEKILTKRAFNIRIDKGNAIHTAIGESRQCRYFSNNTASHYLHLFFVPYS